MDASALKQFEAFIKQCKSNPSILSFPSLSFFRDYIESLGCTIPSTGGDSKAKSRVVDESDEKFFDSEEEDDSEEDDSEEEEEAEIVESDVELDESFVVEPDNEPPQMGDTFEVRVINRDAAQEAKIQAMEAISEGKPEEAIKHLTKAILLNPTSAIMHATRASVYIKMKKPNAAIRDANAALEINPDSAKGYKSRGIARAMLGQWEEAAKDLHVASKLDFDEEISAVLKKVEPNAQMLEEHRKRYDRLRKERDEKKAERERRRRPAEAQAAYESSKSSGGMPDGFSGGMPGGMPGGGFGGMPGGGFGGMPGGGFGSIPRDVDLSQVLSDPEVMESLQDPEIMGALYEIAKNPASLAKHQANPKVVPMLAKMFGKSGGGAKRNFSPFATSALTSAKFAMDTAAVKQFETFIEQCKCNPSILSFPSLSFFRDYIESFGCTILSTGGEEKSRVVDESDEKFFDEPKIVKPEDEIDDSGVVEPDNEPTMNLRRIQMPAFQDSE